MAGVSRTCGSTNSIQSVFLTDAKVESEFLVSEVGNGWAVTTTTLMHERRGADGLRSWAIPPDKPDRIYQEEREEIRTRSMPSASIWSWNGRGRPGRSTIPCCDRRSPRC